MLSQEILRMYATQFRLSSMNLAFVLVVPIVRSRERCSFWVTQSPDPLLFRGRSWSWVGPACMCGSAANLPQLRPAQIPRTSRPAARSHICSRRMRWLLGYRSRLFLMTNAIFLFADHRAGSFNVAGGCEWRSKDERTLAPELLALASR